MSEKPEALRLAHELDAYHNAPHHKLAAIELRRLHAENERLKAVAFQAQDAAIYLAKQNERMAAPRPEPTTVPKSVPLPRITCGFVDVRFDGDGWFCTKCGERMPANYEAMVKHYSGYREYLELMQRKAEALRREETT